MAIRRYALAKAIVVPPRRINEIVKGWRGITLNKALRLSIFFGTDAQSWGNLQTHYDTEHARVAMAGVLGRIVGRELAGAGDTASAQGACSALLGVARTSSKVLFKIDVQLGKS